MSVLLNLSLEYLKERYYYNEADGLLYKKALSTEGLSGPKLGTRISWNNRNKDKPAGSIQKQGYYVTHLRHKGVMAWIINHRVIWEIYHNDKLKEDEHIDHIDGDRSNNKIENLRVVNMRGNASNRAIAKNNNHGVSGIY